MVYYCSKALIVFTSGALIRLVEGGEEVGDESDGHLVVRRTEESKGAVVGLSKFLCNTLLRRERTARGFRSPPQPQTFLSDRLFFLDRDFCAHIKRRRETILFHRFATYNGDLNHESQSKVSDLSPQCCDRIAQEQADDFVVVERNRRTVRVRWR